MKLHQAVYLIFAIGIMVCLAMIIAALCYRVVIDGNSPITETITTQLLYLGAGSILAILGIFGINRIAPPSPSAIPSTPVPLPAIPTPAEPAPPATPAPPPAGNQ